MASTQFTIKVPVLLACCEGSRAALAMLLKDRQSLTDEQLREIIDRLDTVIAEAQPK